MRKVIPKDAILIPDQARRVFNGVIYDVYQWEQPNFDDSVAIFEMLKRPDTVDAICIVDGNILVLNDEQPHRGAKLSLPGGRVDASDGDILAAVKREVREETGYQFANWKLVRVAQPLVKIEWFIHTFIAWGVTQKGDVHHDAGERITVELKAFDEFRALVAQDAGFLGHYRFMVEQLKSTEDLQNLPEFDGQIVDR